MRTWITLVVVAVALLAPPVSAQGGVPDDAILYIPAISLGTHVEYAPIVEVGGLRFNDVSELGDGVAWLEGTAWFTDGTGRVALAGHNPGSFEHLSDLKPGDLIYVFVAPTYTAVEYEVVEKRIVNPAEHQVLLPGDPAERTLVLITCSGLRRLAVLAVRVL